MSKERTVLVTGANSGIGLATVIEVARRGFRSVGSVRSVEKAKAVEEAATAAGVSVETVLMDVTDAEACGRVVEEIGPLYGLVNNAGYGGVGAVEDIDDEEARERLETMVLAPMRLARLALPGMRAAGEGRIINVSSIYGRTTTPLTGWYQACKHALEAVSDALRMEVASAGVKVVLVEPGGFKTSIWEDLERDVERRGHSRYASAYRRTQQLQKMTGWLMGDPDKVAKLIGAILRSRSPRARYLIGYDAQAVVMVDRVTPTSAKDRLRRFVLGL